MTSFILLVIAGVVVYYLYTTFEEYLKNPLPSPQKPQERQEYPPKDNPYSLPTPQDKLKNSYAGASVAMLNILLQAGISQKTPSLLQIALLDNFIKNLHLQESQENLLKQMLEGIDFSQIKKSQSPATSATSKDSDTPISTLAQIFLDNTYGEYKKRLHFVGFALTLAWSDRVLEEKEREVILDIAAFLQLENDEFNELYDSFESRFGTKASEADKANEAGSTNLVEQYKKELEAKQEQSSQNIQEAYQSLIQKLCSKSQVSGEPQAELLAKLLALESAYNAKNA